MIVVTDLVPVPITVLRVQEQPVAMSPMMNVPTQIHVTAVEPVWITTRRLDLVVETPELNA